MIACCNFRYAFPQGLLKIRLERNSTMSSSQWLATVAVALIIAFDVGESSTGDLAWGPPIVISDRSRLGPSTRTCWCETHEPPESLAENNTE